MIIMMGRGGKHVIQILACGGLLLGKHLHAHTKSEGGERREEREEERGEGHQSQR